MQTLEETPNLAPVTWDTLHPTLRAILRMLHTQHFADMEPHDYTADWLRPQVAEYLAAHAQWMTPPAIRYEPYTPYQCHNAALDRLMLYPGSRAWFGYALDVHPAAPTGMVWWIHSWNSLSNNTLLDSYPVHTPSLFWGVPWTQTLLDALGTVADDHPFLSLLTRARWISDGGELFGTGWAIERE
jgi:hypothetical protein